MMGSSTTGRARLRSPSIGLNLTWLDPGVVGGSEEYSVRLVQSLSDRSDGEIGFRLYCRRSLLDRYPDLAGRFPVEVLPVGQPTKATRVLLENTWMISRRRGVDLMHHMGGVIPWIGCEADIVTVYDLQPLEHPQNFSPVKRRWLAAAIPASVNKASLVVTPSAFTADRLKGHLGIAEDKIRLVPFGFDPGGQDSADRDPSEISRAEDANSVAGIARGRFLLYPAITYQHKRHIDIVEALNRLPADCDDIAAVFTGRPGPQTLSLRRRAHDLDLGHRVVFTGRLPESTLTDLYRRAMALVFPSAYEGFGNPCIEAMINRCPILTSDAGSLPEVTGAAAIHIPVGNVSAWADAITRLARSETLVERLRERGRIQLGSFIPETATGRLLGVYREALG